MFKNPIKHKIPFLIALFFLLIGRIAAADQVLISSIADDEKVWHGPLLYELAENTSLNVVGVVHLEYHLCEDYLDKGCGKDMMFDNGIFSSRIADLNTRDTGFPLWLYEIPKYESLYETVKILLDLYRDLAKRLTLLHEDRSRLIETFGDDSFIPPVDGDIRFLSRLGIKLGDTTKKFLSLAKREMIVMEVKEARMEAMRGLSTFMTEIHKSAGEQKEEIDDLINNALKTLTELEEGIAVTERDE